MPPWRKPCYASTFPGGGNGRRRPKRRAGEGLEETGIDPVHLTPVQTFVDDHGNWRYDTVIAHATDLLIAHELNDESHEVRWVDISEVDQLTLHPSFEKSWPALKEILNNLVGPR